jgi:hypothetical protein
LAQETLLAAPLEIGFSNRHGESVRVCKVTMKFPYAAIKVQNLVASAGAELNIFGLSSHMQYCG